MRAEYINPFVNSLVATFDTMLSCRVKRGDLRLKSDHSPPHEVSGIIGLSGKAVGTIVVSFSEKVALEAASAMLMTPMTELDDEVVDAVGEITNMVAGSAKAELQEYQLSISLPNVILGRGYEIRFPSNVHPICVPFRSAWGDCALEVGLAPVANAVEEPVVV